MDIYKRNDAAQNRTVSRSYYYKIFGETAPKREVKRFPPDPFTYREGTYLDARPTLYEKTNQYWQQISLGVN